MPSGSSSNSFRSCRVCGWSAMAMLMLRAITSSSSSSSRCAFVSAFGRGSFGRVGVRVVDPSFSSSRLFSSSSSSSSPPPGEGGGSPVVAEKSEEEKAALKAAREARKAEKQRKAEEKKAKRAAAAAAEAQEKEIAPVLYLDEKDEAKYEAVGDHAVVASRSVSGRVFAKVSELTDADAGTEAWVRGRVQSVRAKGGSCFLVLRQDAYHTLQATFFRDKERPEESKRTLAYLKSLSPESVVDLKGTLVAADVRSCSVSTLELAVSRAHAVSRADPALPFTVEDAARTEAEVEASQSEERPFPRLGQELRLDHRWMDLRVPANHAILRVQAAVCHLFREALTERHGFLETRSPKLLRGESESGAGVFTTDYFGRTACLAQSPQLYKQMAIASDLDRVFEIGPVFRAENSNTRRHLCEFTGLDLEMAIHEHYDEALHVIHDTFKHIFNGLETRYAKDLKVVRAQYHSEPVTFTDEPCVLHWPEAMAILTDRGFDMGDTLCDLTGAMELSLGEAVREKYGTDFFMLDKYPSVVRPFYTMPDPDDARFSNSYDIFLRGQEICSGAQRCHDVDMLRGILREKGIEVDERRRRAESEGDHDKGGTLEAYLESFRHGVPPHAGAGVGLERVVFLYLGLDNVRKASMFPRDPNRCSP